MGQLLEFDIEEANNLVKTNPELTQELNKQLTDMLTEMKASYPYNNPHYNKDIPHQEKIPVVTDNQKEGNKVTFCF